MKKNRSQEIGTLTQLSGMHWGNSSWTGCNTLQEPYQCPFLILLRYAEELKGSDRMNAIKKMEMWSTHRKAVMVCEDCACEWIELGQHCWVNRAQYPCQ